MIDKTNITTKEEAREKIVGAIKHVTDMIRETYGPNGLNISVENELYPYHQIANDAQTIIQATKMDDPVRRRGLNFLKELMDKVQTDSGDGRKTTCIMASEIISLCYSKKLGGVHFKKELDRLIPIVEAFINDNK